MKKLFTYAKYTFLLTSLLFWLIIVRFTVHSALILPLLSLPLNLSIFWISFERILKSVNKGERLKRDFKYKFFIDVMKLKVNNKGMKFSSCMNGKIREWERR